MEDAYEGRRRALAVLRTPDSLDKLFNELAPRYAARQGGYTRVMRSRMREGDGAPMAFVEFVDRPGELRAARPPKGSRFTSRHHCSHCRQRSPRAAVWGR